MSLFELPGAEKYFGEVVARYTASRMLDHGKLNRDNEENGGDWLNVRRHCLIQAAVWNVLGPILGLDETTTRKLGNTAVCHDWEKRISKSRQAAYFTDEEREEAKREFDRLIQIGAVDRKLFDCLTPRFNLRALAGEATFLELLQWYVDDMAKGDEIVPFMERVAEVAARNPDPEPEMIPELAEFGFTNYWDSERAIGDRVGKMIVAIIRGIGVTSIDSPESIPSIINHCIAAQINAPAATPVTVS